MSNRTGAGTTGPLFRSSGRAARRKPVDPEVLLRHGGRITAIEEQKDPKRRSLFVDGEFALGLDLETVIRCGFKVGLPVEGPQLLRAQAMDMEKKAWDSALNLLAMSPRSAAELGRRLARNFPADLVEHTLSRLEAGGWLDDGEFAAAYIRSHREHGARRLLADLARKGVARDLAARAVEEALGEVDAAEQAREVAARRLTRMGAVDRETAQRRLTGLLARRGFGLDAIGRALAPLLQDLPRQEKRFARRSEEPDTPAGSSLQPRGSSLGRGGPGTSTLKRNASLQRKRRFGSYEEEEPET